jgi:hypothetical protein
MSSCGLAWSQECSTVGKTGARDQLLEVINEGTVGVRKELWWHAVAAFNGTTERMHAV